MKQFHSSIKNLAISGIASTVLTFGNAWAQSDEGVFVAGEALGSTSESGDKVPLSDNVRVFGAYHFAESCTFDPQRNLILAMNAGARGDGTENDGFVSLINPDGTVHTSKWIGVNRDGLALHHPLGSAVRNGKLYTVDSGFVKVFDLVTGRPLQALEVPGATLLNGIGVADDGTIYASNTRPPEKVYRVSPDGKVSVFAEGAPLARPNGVAIDNDGNIVVVNIGDNAVLTFDTSGKLINTENAVEGGNDGVIITANGTKYVSSVRHGSISKIVPGKSAEVIANGIPSAASMCYDSIQNQLIIPMNSNNAMGFVKLD